MRKDAILNYLRLYKRTLNNNIKVKVPTIVIESDDWGNIRMPSKEIYQKAIQRFPKYKNCHYLRYDAIESIEDLNIIYNSLENIYKKTGKKVIITANVNVCNPDFQKIKDSNYTQYHLETLQATINRYNVSEGGFTAWKEIIDSDYFKPQYHGREHVNTFRWLKDLNEGNQETLFAFQNNFYGISNSVSSIKRKSYLETYAVDHEGEQLFKINSFLEGLVIFRKIFGYSSKSFIAPNYAWNYEVEKVCLSNGVGVLQGTNLQINAKKEFKDERLVRLSRNVFFEPSSKKEFNWVKNALREIEFSFLFGRPAIICMHRFNLIGRLDKQNQKDNVRMLIELLSTIIKKYPNVEFKSSDQFLK